MIDRRTLLAATPLLLTLRPSSAQPAGHLEQAITGFAQGKPVQRGRVKLQIETLVDNGNLVPVAVQVDSPMSAADHVVSIGIFNDRNPQRDVAVFSLGPRAGKALVGTRMRLATSQKLAALARMSDGSVWMDTADVVVALAACIEGT